MSLKALFFDEEQKREFLVWELLEAYKENKGASIAEDVDYLRMLHEENDEEIERRFDNLLNSITNAWDEERTEEILNEFLVDMGYNE